MKATEALPKLSIVTPSFNQAAYLEEALQSVKEQGYPHVEHWVIDGGSTDGSVGVLKRLSRQAGWSHLHWISEPDRGQSDALNKGFRRATGDLIGWLNSDDRYRSHCFETIVRAAAAHPEADVLYGDYTFMDEHGSVRQLRREIEFSSFVLHYHRVLYIPSTATFFRRHIFDQKNLIDLKYHYAMDYEFFLRLAAKGYRFQHLPGLLADFRWHPASKSGGQASQQLSEHDAIAELYSPLLRRIQSPELRKMLLQPLRMAAAAVRYSEKMRRGYYLEQYRSGV